MLHLPPQRAERRVLIPMLGSGATDDQKEPLPHDGRGVMADDAVLHRVDELLGRGLLEEGCLAIAKHHRPELTNPTVSVRQPGDEALLGESPTRAALSIGDGSAYLRAEVIYKRAIPDAARLGNNVLELVPERLGCFLRTALRRGAFADVQQQRPIFGASGSHVA